MLTFVCADRYLGHADHFLANVQMHAPGHWVGAEVRLGSCGGLHAMACSLYGVPIRHIVVRNGRMAA